MTKTRLGLLAVGLVLISLPAMYLSNPFNTTLADPRARIFGFTLYRAPSLSMEPTIGHGSTFLVNVAALRKRDPGVGEIIVFRYPPSPDVLYLKRVVATGGMTIEMRGGEVWLDGKRLEEPWLPRELASGADIDGHHIEFRYEDLHADMSPMLIPEHHFFVLGDNRGYSSDSRSWGLVPRDHVVGTYQR
jgi:signal peptidase I